MPAHTASESPNPSFPGNNPATPRTFYSFQAGQSWTPAVNLYETDRAYIVCVDLAGVEKQKIDVELDGQMLTFQGNRQVPTDFEPEALSPSANAPPTSKRCKVHVMEIDHGGFARTIELPANADKASITALYREGLLWIDVPKNAPSTT